MADFALNSAGRAPISGVRDDAKRIRIASSQCRDRRSYVVINRVAQGAQLQPGPKMGAFSPRWSRRRKHC